MGDYYGGQPPIIGQCEAATYYMIVDGGAKCYSTAMPRLARIAIPGVPHHIVQRGNNRQDVFFVDDDRRAYLGFLKEHAEPFELQGPPQRP